MPLRELKQPGFRLLFPWRFARLLSWREQVEGASFMDRNMIRFVALDQVLRRLPGRMVHVFFESGVGSDLFDDNAANPASFRVPPHVITYAEGFRHCLSPDYC